MRSLLRSDCTACTQFATVCVGSEYSIYRQQGCFVLIFFVMPSLKRESYTRPFYVPTVVNRVILIFANDRRARREHLAISTRNYSKWYMLRDTGITHPITGSFDNIALARIMCRHSVTLTVAIRVSYSHPFVISDISSLLPTVLI